MKYKLLLFFFLFNTTFAQKIDYSKKVFVRLKDNNIFSGKIIKKDSNTVKFSLYPKSFFPLKENTIDTVVIKLSDNTLVKGILNDRNKKIKVRLDTLVLNNQTIDSIANYRLFDTQRIPSNYYFFTSTAFNLKKGEFAYQNKDIICNYLSYGINNSFSLTIGSSWGISPTFIQKYSFNSTKKVRFSVSNSLSLVSLSAILDTRDNSINSLIGFLVGNMTMGDSNKNLTLGLGVAYSNVSVVNKMAVRENLKFGGNYYALNGMIRLNSKLTLFSENLFFTGNQTAFNAKKNIDKNPTIVSSNGIKILHKRNCIDIGILVPMNYDIATTVIPLVGYQHRFH